MKFSGPTHNGTDWNSNNVIEITFDSKEELEKANNKYFKSRRAVVRTSTSATPGDSKTLKFSLPGGHTFAVRGEVEKVKEQADKPYGMALFKLLDFTKEKQETIKQSLQQDDDLFGDSFDIPLTADFEEPVSEPAKPATSSGAAQPVKRTEEEESMLRAYLSDEGPEDEDLIDIELPEELKGVSGDMIMPKKDDEEDDPFLEHKKFVVAFILLFTKSVQRSGYYGDANHPEAVKSKKGLYALFRKIIGKNREISFIRKAIGKERDILIDGVLTDMITLREIMPHGMAELYIPRFMDYLERRCLISFSIKRIINETNFNEFISLLSQYSPEFKDDARKEGERFTRTLIEHGVAEVSAIFDEDIISSGRKLPWQAELTLSRLKKDLKTVPLLKNATEDELRQIKLRIFTDTITPLRVPDFLIAVLLNSDLIMEGIEDSPVLRGIDVEHFMINGAELEFLAETSIQLINEIEGVRELQIKAPLEAQRKAAEKHEKVLMRIFKHVTDRFFAENNEVTDYAYEEFFLHKLIPYKTLPLRVQEHISNKKLMEAFLSNADEILERFNSPVSNKEFSDFISRFQRVIPLLSEKKEYILVSKILDSTRKHLDDRDVRRKSLTKRLFDYISSTNILKDLREVFDSDDKEMRDMALSVFISFGRQAVPILLDLLKNHEDKWVRKKIIRSIIDIGAAAVQPMVNELYKEDNPWYFLRNIINILGELGDRRIVGKLNLLLYNDHPAVREETVRALFRISPETSESHLIKALSDEDAKVRETAISCLGRMESKNEKVLQFYIDILEGKSELANEALQIQVYRAVGNLGNLDAARKKNIEAIMIKNLEQVYGSGIMAMFKKPSNSELSDGLKMAITTALGLIGSSKKSIKLLTKVSKEKDPILVQKANEALKLIEFSRG